MKRFFFEVFNKTLLVLIAILIVGSFFVNIPSKSWLTLFLNISLFSLIYIIFMLIYGFNNFERDLILLPIKKKIGFINKK